MGMGNIFCIGLLHNNYRISPILHRRFFAPQCFEGTFLFPCTCKETFRRRLTCGLPGSIIGAGLLIEVRILATKRAKYQDNDTVSDVFRHLLSKHNKTIVEVAEKTKIPLNTLYALSNRKSRSVNIRNLKKLADYFNEDLSIFCGLAGYVPPPRLTLEQQQLVYDYDTLTIDAQLEVLGLIKRLRADPKNIARLI